MQMSELSSPSSQHAIVYGGTGFIGSEVARQLSESGMRVSCISRSGTKPAHLTASEGSWSQAVNWCHGDIEHPDSKLLESADIVITAVGSPPLPTFSRKAYHQQYRANGGGNIVLLKACLEAKVQRFVLISAEIPKLLQRKCFAYYRGKNKVFEQAKKAAREHDISIAVIQPSLVYGTRHTRSGKSIPLGFLNYVSKTIVAMPKGIQQVVPSAPVSVLDIAKACGNFCLNPKPENNFEIIDNDILIRQT
jgi:nucleoside-diphosphate-sugar epimerase